ncbi:MAG: hypothetical protein KKD05_04285 [Candidatus Omnitrophica bacterium]|nr:hypothetical protein [Candidatus Omnitrophota bacterium]
MKLKTKKFIAREGLVILGVFIAFIISWYFVCKGDKVNLFNNIALMIIIFYLVYLIFRFSVWAVKTLKKKED